MNFYSIRQLYNESEKILNDLDKGDEVVITNNGKASAVMIGVPDGNFDEVIQTFHQTKAMIALNNMRKKAAAEGFKTDEEIELFIKEARNEYSVW